VAWQHGVLRYVEEVTIIALSNKYDKRVYKVKIIGFVWDYPFQLDDFEKGMIFNTIKRKQMADFN
jgi:hypothetical protein